MVFFWLLKTSEESEQTMSVIFGLSFISHVSVLLGAVRIGKVFREHWIIWFAPSNTWKVVITLIVNQDVILVSILSRMAQIFCGKSWILLGQSKWERNTNEGIIKEIISSPGFKICFVKSHSLALRPDALLHSTLVGSTGRAGSWKYSQFPRSATPKKFLHSAFFIPKVCELRFLFIF